MFAMDLPARHRPGDAGNGLRGGDDLRGLGAPAGRIWSPHILTLPLRGYSNATSRILEQICWVVVAGWISAIIDGKTCRCGDFNVVIVRRASHVRDEHSCVCADAA